MKRSFPIFGWLITIAIPLLLLMTSIRLMLSPIFFEYEYRSPGFPPDPYGLNLDQRIKWSKISLDYLLNDQGISFLENQMLSETQPLYNPAELSHMVDVKNLIQAMIKGWTILLLAILGLGIWAWRAGWSHDYGFYISRGGWMGVLLIIAVIFFTFTSFDALFTSFHRIFFKGDTWIFLYSDTLIRLFPIRFWQDAFILTGAFTGVGSLALIFIGKKLGKQKDSI
jgi:integral membrane protein (TIGR01906 family)